MKALDKQAWAEAYNLMYLEFVERGLLKVVKPEPEARMHDWQWQQQMAIRFSRLIQNKQTCRVIWEITLSTKDLQTGGQNLYQKDTSCSYSKHLWNTAKMA
jgi:hypothetical protein